MVAVTFRQLTDSLSHIYSSDIVISGVFETLMETSVCYKDSGCIYEKQPLNLFKKKKEKEEKKQYYKAVKQDGHRSHREAETDIGSWCVGEMKVKNRKGSNK